MKKVIIYTDGACSGNPGPGGWGAIIKYKTIEKEISGGKSDTTNNKMELLAAIKALESLKEACEVKLYTDSKYVKHGITEWIHNWKKNGWRGANKKPVKNVELWQKLDEVVARHKVSWHWVKGHSGNLYNDRVDKLAVRAIKRS